MVESWAYLSLHPLHWDRKSQKDYQKKFWTGGWLGVRAGKEVPLQLWPVLPTQGKAGARTGISPSLVFWQYKVKLWFLFFYLKGQ